jgi:hypothetical protein
MGSETRHIFTLRVVGLRLWREDRSFDPGFWTHRGTRRVGILIVPSLLSGRVCHVRRCAFLLLCFVMGVRAAADGAPRSQVKIISVSRDELKYVELTPSSVVRVAPMHIILWGHIPADKDPQRFYWDAPVDVEALYLERGYAKLRDKGTAPPTLVEAERQAQAAKLGMWAPAPVAVWRTVATTGGSGLLAQIGRIAVVIVGFCGGWELLGAFIRWRRRYRVDVMFFGSMSVGKTWLWLRTMHPNVSAATLRQQRATLANAAKTLPPMPVGEYTMKPVFADMAGSRPGEQLTHLVDRRRFWWLQKLVFPQKRVWIISLAPTTDSSVTRSSSPELRLDRDHMQRQLGWLVLYEAALREPQTHKPALVVICLTKVDLFVDDESDLAPNRPGGHDIRQYFRESISRLEAICREEHVPSIVVLTSALHGWGRRDFGDALRDAFFPPAT